MAAAHKNILISLLKSQRFFEENRILSTGVMLSQHTMRFFGGNASETAELAAVNFYLELIGRVPNGFTGQAEFFSDCEHLGAGDFAVFHPVAKLCFEFFVLDILFAGYFPELFHVIVTHYVFSLFSANAS
jgi:hypothetical protein